MRLIPLSNLYVSRAIVGNFEAFSMHCRTVRINNKLERHSVERTVISAKTQRSCGQWRRSVVN